MNKKSADLLKLGIGLLIIGILLAYYSLVSFIDFRTLSLNVDFDSVDNNLQISDMDKYYKYLSYADYLNQKLDKNKDLIIKNESCAYLDYAHHNVVMLYNLTDKKITEQTKKDAAIGVVKDLSSRLNYYSTCRNYALYKTELAHILSNQEKRNEIYQSQRMNMFSNGESQNQETEEISGIERVADVQAQAEAQSKEQNKDSSQRALNEETVNQVKENIKNEQKESETNQNHSADYPQIRY